MWIRPAQRALIYFYLRVFNFHWGWFLQSLILGFDFFFSAIEKYNHFVFTCSYLHCFRDKGYFHCFPSSSVGNVSFSPGWRFWFRLWFQQFEWNMYECIYVCVGMYTDYFGMPPDWCFQRYLDLWKSFDLLSLFLL